MKILQLIKSSKAILKRVYRACVVVAHSNATMIDQYLYARDITKRKLKRQVSLAIGILVIFLLGAISTPLLGLYGPKAIPAAIKSSVQALIALGAWLNLSSDFATIIVAEILAIGGMSLIARIFRGKREWIGPYIFLLPKLPETDSEGVKHYKVVVSNEKGNRAAISCQARLILSEVEKKDILALQTAKLNPENFTRTIKADLFWDNGSKQNTLRSGDESQIEVLKLVPARDGTEAHFEIPSCDKHWDSVACLRLKTFYPMIEVLPFNGKHVNCDFTLSYQSKNSTEPKDWLLS
ncbi:MAG: hypothetical protein WB643_06975 [Candidatus Bathyarchaeia archaeon]